MAEGGGSLGRLRLLAALLRALPLIVLALFPVTSQAATAPPGGLTGIALDGRVDLAWQPVSGATGYTVYRGTSAASITTRLTDAAGVTGASYSDTTAVNTTTYYYAVRAVSAGSESPNSLTVQATPRSRSCSSGNGVVVENCFPGNSGWSTTSVADVPGSGIEGYATAPSINKGASVDLKINTTANVAYRIEVYRTGFYNGAGARLMSTIRGLTGVAQPTCASDSNTGLVDCSNWSVSATLTTTSAWTSGVYLLRLVREDNSSDNHILLVVRDDANLSKVLFGTPVATYQAYNSYGGKSLYDFNSSGGNTVAGTPRAVKVSYDRPFHQPRDGLRDWYPVSDFPWVTWLEREGYDVTYAANTDLERNGARVRDHVTYISPTHDEYVSAGMRTALEQGRDAGVNLLFGGSNEVYWKIRFENSPSTGAQDRVQVCYKSTQLGSADPSGIPTGTWRDPAGANNPENALSGIMYIGDNDTTSFPITVSASQGTDRVFRYTGLDAQRVGTSTSIGPAVVGWEWDARVANGREPPGVTTLAASLVTGELVQNSGAFYVPGTTTSEMAKYIAASGALVVATGTNYWSRGLALNAVGVGEPDQDIQQITTNILVDMSAPPQTPSAGLVLDNPPNLPPPPIEPPPTGGAEPVPQSSTSGGASGSPTGAGADTRPRAAIVTNRAAVRTRGRVGIAVRCAGAGGTTCSGRLVLTVRISRTGALPKDVTVGSARFGVASGRGVTLRVPLSKWARTRLARAGAIRVRVRLIPATTTALAGESRSSLVLVATRG